MTDPGTLVHVDLELGRDERFHAMAARRDGVDRVWESSFDAAHRELVAWIGPDDVLVGHNLHPFDRPQIERLAPDSPLLALPTLDTLELSVLAVPQRPYHALAKDDRLVRDARPNPLSDVRATDRLVNDALEALRRLDPPERDLLAALLARMEAPEHARRGWRHLFGLLGWPWRPETPIDLKTSWADRVCANSPRLPPPRITLPLVLVSAWLRVAHHRDGSVLPGWVRRQFPETPALVRDLRATSCDACDWCHSNLRPERWLREVFGFDGFRAEPAAPDGGSLQRTLVERGLSGDPTFGILPTGGGKSLCFQVPAEARYRLLGQLTLVISPLQSLMKDQVDALAQRLPHARAIYGGLPSLLRPIVLDEVRSGATGLLYLSPEQFRNPGILRLLDQRELGAIVFDEAHCLSQWGHDFRTDYPYVLKALRTRLEAQGLPMPPVFLFTATAQHDAIAEIRAHVEAEAGRPVTVLDGGSERDNLTYEVRSVPEHARVDVIAELLGEHLGAGSAIVFCGSRARTEQIAERLTGLGYPAVAYHAGLDADERRTRQDAFLAGEHRVVTATNAFGMGVDKADVRLVVHADMPSSLEAYLQEAGRAGRDRKPATAVLLWAPGDAESRFSLGALGNLDVDDLTALWRAIQQLPSQKLPDRETRVVTARELLFQEALAGRFDPLAANEETRVKAGVNWLERAAVLERLENHTQVFAGRPRAPSLDQALAEVDRLDLSPPRAAQWRVILARLFDSDEEGLSADDIAILCKQMSYDEPLEGGLRILEVLTQMVEAGMVDSGQTFTAFVRKGVVDASTRRLVRWADRERAMLDLLEDATDELVHLRAVGSRLSDSDLCAAEDVARMLQTWAGPTATPLVWFRRRGSDTAVLRLERPLVEVRAWLQLRRDVAARILEHLLEQAPESGAQVLVASTLEALVQAMQGDLVLSARRSPSDDVRAAVAWLHDLRVITVQSGLAVFRSAMRLDRRPGSGLGDAEARAARAALQQHQSRQILRIHVMDAWAQRMLDDPAAADAMRADWFRCSLADFAARWFPGDPAAIERPTTPQSWAAIVTALRDPVQEAIVTADPRRNHLVLAGPGSGKTRVLVHRVAWLLRCQRVRAGQILVVCYTRANAVELRRRLVALVGDDARGVRIDTLHAVALRMAGVTPDGETSLEACIRDAASLLRGEGLDPGDQPRQRDGVLRGFQYLLVDEYQDIDADRYALLSAIAGRGMPKDQRKLRVFAVGDDDQAIYGFDGSSTDFIRSFEDDYGARRVAVPHSYRVPAAVLELAQGVVEGLPGRLKAGSRLTVDPARRGDPPEVIPWTRCPSVRDAARELMARVGRLLQDGVAPRAIGVLSHTRPQGLERLRLAAEAARIGFSWQLPSGEGVPIARIREVVRVSEVLHASEGYVSADVLERTIDELGVGPWANALRGWLEPSLGRSRHRDAWLSDLYLWAWQERRARTIGEGVHLGTIHAAKGLEFDHVFVLDDGTLTEAPDHRRLLYVALTRARRSLSLFSDQAPSPVFAALRHPLLRVESPPMLVADAPADRSYGVVGPDAIWLDWLGRKPPEHPAHEAWVHAVPGDVHRVERRGDWAAVVDGAGREVAMLSAQGKEVWLPRVEQDLRLKLLAVVRESAERRAEPYREELRVPSWWTGVWEARWRPG